MIHIFILLLSLSFAFLCLYSSRKQDLSLALIMSFVVILTIGLRYDGIDYDQYFYIYDNVKSFDYFSIFGYDIDPMTPIESGFYWLALIEKSLSNHFYNFIFIIAFISVLMKFFSFEKLSPYICLSFFLYICLDWYWKDLSQIRNGIATAFCLFSLYYLYNKEKVKFLFFVFIGSLFHLSSFIMMVSIFCRYMSYRFLYFLVSISIIVAYFGGVGLILSELFSMLGFSSTSRIVKYAESGLYVDGISLFGGTSLFYLVTLFLLALFKDELVYKWPINRLLIKVYIVGLSLTYLFIDYGILSGRISDMLVTPLLVVLLPSFMLLKSYDKFFCLALLMPYLIVWFVTLLSKSAAYTSILGFLI
ncbi:putative EpsG family protein [Vibrio crassostreae]|nr:EpsG-like putative glucosyltransferase [Vibrio crassostreae]TCT51344.1 EpsG-like putative glucosyltransferase [Vibrio crassostreae]TCT70245.1 EpsG-like putative glucosyltransferase [Vibrio crassostreae]TCT76173.1 EpsG-like putative glucosyltransferase [Vibrio crassostreae]TCT95363.1 EpsG-like putative glucosyltransferase [Vibrio crassostreae]